MEEYKEKLKELFNGVGEAQRLIAYDTINDYIFFVDQLNNLKQLPQIRVDKKNPNKQERTIASKMVKEYSQTISNLRKILLTILYKSDTGDSGSVLDELLSKFEEK